MNRIEKIKKRIDEAYYEGYELADDISCLLSKLEIAEKALEKVKHNGALDVNGEDAENTLIVCGDIAKEALQQIRE
jgi:hypothetical protein